jgi:hypothetical protein
MVAKPLVTFRETHPAAKPACAYLRFFFAYTGPMWNLPQTQLCDFAIRCKGCAETIPAPVATVPDTSFVAVCPLCGEKRRYLPPDVFRGKLSHMLKGRLISRLKHV